MIADLTKLAERKLREARDKAARAVSEAGVEMEVMERWIPKYSAPAEAQTVAEIFRHADMGVGFGNPTEAQIAVEAFRHSTQHQSNGTYLSYLEATRHAIRAAAAAKQACQKQRAAMIRAIETKVGQINGIVEQLRPSAMKHARRAFQHAERAFDETKGLLSRCESFEDCKADLSKLVKVENSLHAVSSAIDASSVAKAESLSAVGAVLGGVVGFVVYAIGVFVAALALYVVTCGYFGHPHLLDGFIIPILMLVGGFVGIGHGGARGAKSILKTFTFHKK